MKKILANAGLLATLIMAPSAANALAVDSYYTDFTGNKKFELVTRAAAPEVSGCGFVVVSSLGNKEVMKMSIYSEHVNGKEVPPQNFVNLITHMKIDVGSTDKNGRFKPYKTNNVKISADWLNADLNVDKFPSGGEVGGEFPKILLKAGFDILFETAEKGKKKIQVRPGDVPENVLYKFESCSGYVVKSHGDRWAEMTGNPLTCFFVPGADECKDIKNN